MRRLALVGAGLALLVDLLYLVIIGGQPGEVAVSLRVPFVATFLGAMAALAGFAVRPGIERYAPMLLTLSGAGLLAIAIIAMFSIGFAVLVAAVPIAIAAALAVSRGRGRAAVLQPAAGAAIGLTVFVLGIALTEVPIACRGTGFEAGSGPGLFRGPYHWSCANGVLTVAPGLCTRAGATVDRDGHVISTSDC